MTERVTLYVDVDGKPTDPEDEGVPGLYMVKVDDDLSRENQASAALDVLHEHVSIACLDDFDFTVVDEHGSVLSESDDSTGYALSDRGEFCGSANRASLPRGRGSR